MSLQYDQGYGNRGYTGHSQDAFPQSNPNPYAATPYRSDTAQYQPQNNGAGAHESYEMTTYIGNDALEAAEIISGQVKDSKQMMANVLQLRRKLIGNIEGDTTSHKHNIDKAMAEMKAYNKQLVENIQRARGKFGVGTRIDHEMESLRKNMQEYTEAERQIAGELEGQLAASWKIANGIDANDRAGDEMAREAVRSGAAVQIFQNAAMGARRQGARNALSNAQARQQEIQHIAEQMEELLTLFDQMNKLVIEQEAPIEEIVKKTDETREDMNQGVIQLDSGIEKAKSARRKKWWCLLIVVILIVIIVIVIMVVVVKPIIQESNKNKRSLEYLAHSRRNIIEGLASRRSIPPQARRALLE